MMGAAEKAGSGIDKIRRGWSSQHWRSPIVRESAQPDRVMWILPMISLIPEEALARLKLRFGPKFQTFTPLEVQVLVTADLEGWVDNARMRQITTEHSADMTRMLQKMVSKGVIVQDRSGRWARYQLNPENSFIQNESTSAHISAHINEQISNSELIALKNIAKKIRSNRYSSYKEIETTLLNLCENKWLTRTQLSKLIGRHPNGLRYRFLTPMVELGLLTMRYPDKPTHEDQAYSSNMNKD